MLIFGFFEIVQVFFVCVELSWVGGEGGAPWTEEMGVRRVGAQRVGFRRVGARMVGPKISRFFPSPAAKFSFLPSLGVLSWNFGGV